MNYNEMSAAQCADWLAEKDGWHYEPTQVDGMGETREYWWKWTISSTHGGRTYAYKPPFALTLDAAAGALREPWRLVRLDVSKSGRALAVIYCESPEKWEHMSGPDELTARYRAAVAARMEEDK